MLLEVGKYIFLPPAPFHAFIVCAVNYHKTEVRLKSFSCLDPFWQTYRLVTIRL